jgi:hypothetical protein
VQIDFAIKEKGAAAPTLVTTEIVDMIAFEQEFNLSISTLGENPRMSYLSWLAWHAMHRTGRTQLPFMEWAATLEDITGEEAADPVPLESTPSTGSSPASQ